MNDIQSSRRRFVVSVGTAALVGLAGCGAQQGESTQTTTQQTTAQTETTTLTETTDTPTKTQEPANDADGPVVEMKTDNEGSYFDPKGLVVEPGTTVHFVNTSGTHSTAAYHPDNGDRPLRIPDGADPWQSKLFTNTDAVFEHTFETEGVYDFYCAPHEMLGMVGRIVVGGPQGGPATESPTDVPPAAQEALPPVETIVAEQRISGP